MLLCCRMPIFSISRIGHRIDGQNNTNAATAAAAVRLDVVRRHPTGENKLPHQVHSAR
jgi:hypothetical protein